MLEKLSGQSAKPESIIVIDSGSTDSALQTAKQYNCKIIKVDRKNFDHGTTRNLAVKQADADFAVFLTQDAMPADEFLLEKLIEPFNTDSNIAVCYGRQLPRDNASPLERFAREFNYPQDSLLKSADDIKKWA